MTRWSESDLAAARQRMAQVRGMVAKKLSKYRAQPVTIDGHRFDSKFEGKRYAELKFVEKAGKLTKLEIHPKFALHAHGQLICHYEADFAYLDEAGKYIVEDVKGFKTDVYRIKKKMFEAEYGIELTEVRK